MSFTLKVLDSGLEALDLSGDTYGVHEATLVGVGEPGIVAAYAEGQNGGSSLTQRRHENRVIEFALKIETTAATAVDDVESARNAVANLIDKARRYSLRDSASLGVRDTTGEILLKYRKSGATHANYARLLDGELRDDPSEHSALSALRGSGASAKVIYIHIPVRLVLEPYWRPERDVYLRNVLINGGFEAGFASGVPYGWTYTNSANTTGDVTAESTSFVRSGQKSVRIEFTGATGSGTDRLSQTVTLADVGLSVGQTIAFRAQVYIYSRTGSARAGLQIVFRDSLSATIANYTVTTTTGGSWQALQLVRDIPTGTASIRVDLMTQAQAAGDTLAAFWDNAQLQPHVDNLLLTGGFESDADSSGIADNWSVASSGSAVVGTGVTSGALYDGVCQSVARTGGVGLVLMAQSVTLSDHAIRPGDVLTASVWCKVIAADAGTSAVWWLRFLDASGRYIETVESDALSVAGDWTYLSATGTVPTGAATVEVNALLPETASASAIYTLWDWATLYLGHHDGSAGRLWPYTSEWTDSSRLILDSGNTNGKQMVMAHSGLRGNVPSPARLVLGLGHTAPATVLTGYKRGNTNWQGLDTASGTAVATLTAGGTSGMIGGSSRRWTPGGTAETSLLTWVVTDLAPGRYLIAIGLKVSATGRFKFRAGARAYSGVATNAGVWTPDLVKAPPWESSAARQVWPIGVLELPPVNRMGSYVNDFLIELLARCTDTTGSPTVDLDFLYLIPVDGYAEVQPSPNANAVASAGAPNVGILELDSIRDFLPIFTLGPADGTAELYELDGIQDVGQLRGQRFYLGEEGKFLVAHLCNTGFDPSYPVNVGLFYRPQFTTPVSE